jgi:hypothetical protein
VSPAFLFLDCFTLPIAISCVWGGCMMFRAVDMKSNAYVLLAIFFVPHPHDLNQYPVFFSRLSSRPLQFFYGFKLGRRRLQRRYDRGRGVRTARPRHWMGTRSSFSQPMQVNSCFLMLLSCV